MRSSKVQLALLASLALGFACKSEESGGSAPASGTKPATSPTPASTEAKTPTPTPSTPSVTPTAPPTVVGGSAELESLLDLVASGADVYVVTRSPLDFVDGVGSLVLGGKTAWNRLLDALADPSRGPDADKGMRRVLDEFDVLRTTLVGGGLHLDRGMVVSGRGDDAVLVLSADDVEALPKILLTFDPTPKSDPMRCKAVADRAGWVACSDKAAALEAYAPGKAGATIAAGLTTELGAAAVSSLNVAASFPAEGGRAMIGVHTEAGVLQVDVVSPQLAAFAAFDAPGAASALSLVSPGASFMWGRFDVVAAAEKAKAAPGMVTSMIRALSGELLVAGIGSLPGMVMLIGLDDPTPVAGLVPMAGLAKDKIPSTLPDGSKLSFAIEEVDDGSGAKVQVIRLTIEPTGEFAKLREQLGWSPEVVAFVGKQWAALGLGTSVELVPEVAKATAGGPSEALLASLPPRLADDLRGGRVSSLMHGELDGLHAPSVRDQLVTALAGLPASSVPVDVALDSAFALLSPVSSVSAWTTASPSGAVVHVAVRSFGDGSSDEGKDAATARVDVVTGKRDAATAYGDLVTRYPSSPRLVAYKARAGQGDPRGVTGAVAGAGAVSAIAISAFRQYIGRAKSAGSTSAPAVPAVPAP